MFLLQTKTINVIFLLLPPPRMFSLCLFVCLVAGLCKNLLNRFFTKFGGKVTHGLRKKALDFGGNPDHIRVTVDCPVPHRSGLCYDYTRAKSYRITLYICVFYSVFL